MNYQDIQRKHYNAIADTYILMRSNKNTTSYRNVLWSEFLKIIDKNLAHKKKLVGCEAMCGYCEASSRISKIISESDILAFDFSEQMVKNAKSIKLSSGNRLRVIHEDVMNFKKPNTYDYIVLIGGLHHIFRNADKIVDNIYLSLKKGGIFINFEPTNNFPLVAKLRDYIYHRNSIFESETEHDFTLKMYNAFFENAGFRLVDQFYPGLLGYVLYYNPDAFPILNIGTVEIVKLLAKLDIFLGRTFFGKLFSFNTFTVAMK